MLAEFKCGIAFDPWWPLLPSNSAALKGWQTNGPLLVLGSQVRTCELWLLTSSARCSGIVWQRSWSLLLNVLYHKYKGQQEFSTWMRAPMGLALLSDLASGLPTCCVLRGAVYRTGTPQARCGAMAPVRSLSSGHAATRTTAAAEVHRCLWLAVCL